MKVKHSKFHITLEIIGLLVLVGMFIFVGVKWGQLPEQIPAHYNTMGKVDRWGSKNEILIIPVVTLLIYLGITVLSFFPHKWNVPVEITDENRERVYQALMSMIIVLKIEMVIIFAYLTYCMGSIKSLPTVFLPISIILLVATLTFFIVQTYQRSKEGS